MNKKATKAFGPSLAAMNSSKYPSMMAKGLSAPTYQTSATNINASSNVSNSSSVNNNSSSVYNYSLNVGVSGTSASPDDIARTVITQIRHMDARRLRGNTY